MRFVVRYRINHYDIYNENKKMVSMIQMKVIFANCLDVYDEAGNRRYRVMRDCGKIVIKTAKGEKICCTLKYPVDESGRIIQEGYARPPMAEKAVANTQLGELVLCQTKRRDFFIYLNNRKVGELLDMLSISKKILLSDEIPEAFCGLLFAVGYLTLHDDDVGIV